MEKTIKLILMLLTPVFLIVSTLINISLLSALTINSVLIEPNEISQGDLVNIEIDLKNNGEEDINNIDINLDLQELPFAPFESSSGYGIAEIKSGKIKSARFKLITLSDAKSQIYKIPVKITYFEENELQVITKISLISLGVISKPIIGINVEENLLLKGKNNELSIKVINKGLGDIKFLEIEIMDSNNFDLLSSKKVYIGDLDSDDFDTVSFKVFFKENIPNKINFPIKIEYSDSLNKEYSENLNISLDVYAKEKAKELGLIEKNYYAETVSLVITLILAFILYRIWKTSKRKKIINDFK